MIHEVCYSLPMELTVYKIIQQGGVTYILFVGKSATAIQVNVKGQGCRFVLS